MHWLMIFTWPVVRMSRSASGQGRWAWPTKRRYLWCSWMVPNDLKHIQASLSLISTGWLRLRAAQVPRCRDKAIFVVTTDRQANYFAPVYACGVIIRQVTIAHISQVACSIHALWHLHSRWIRGRWTKLSEHLVQESHSHTGVTVVHKNIIATAH